jgi:Mrp family chromosome partitioning ATPase
VIFDAPPVLAVTDAPLLASKLDGLLLVIKAGATLRDHAERAKEVLERAHVRILGAVLTNAPRDTAQGSY